MRSYLIALRNEKKMTQACLAEKLDISESYYSQIENAERQRNMDISLISRLASALDVSIMYIIEALGMEGGTGYCIPAEAVHLHFDVNDGRSYVDPLPYLTGEKTFDRAIPATSVKVGELFDAPVGKKHYCEQHEAYC